MYRKNFESIDKKIAAREVWNDVISDYRSLKVIKDNRKPAGCQEKPTKPPRKIF